MLNSSDVLVVPEGIVSREVDGELVVVLPEEGRYVVLNPTGAQMIDLADGERTLDEIATQIAERFGAEPEQVRADVLKFAEDLHARGVLVRES